MGWPIERKVQVGLGITAAVLCALGMIAYALIVSFVNTSNWVVHTHLVIEAIQGARTGLDDCETSVRGYLLTHDHSYLSPYNLVRGRIPGVIDRLLILTSDNSAQRVRLAQLKSQVDREIGLLQQTVDIAEVSSTSPAAVRELLDQDQQLMSTIRNTLRETLLTEDQLLSAREAAWRQDLTTSIIAAGALGLLNFVLLASIYYFFKWDLTERRSVEAALHASEERLRLLIASVKDYAFFMLDPQGRVATWNEGAAIIKGYEASEIMGQHFSTFFSEEDRKADKPKRLLEQAEKEGRVEDEAWRVRKDGSQFWADAITSAIRDERGHLLGYSEVTRDLTQQKLTEEKIQQSQSRLAAILDGSPSAIFVKDPEGRYDLVNQRFEESFRLGREQVLGKTDLDVFPRDIAQKLREHDAKTLEAGRMLETEEIIPQQDGLHTYLAARVPLLGENHEPYALCGVSTDITERKKSEQEIQRLNRTLQDRVIDHSVELLHAADELKMEREQRQGAEEREREVLNRLSEVMHSSAVPMWTYDLETMALLEVNDAAVALHGSSRVELSKMRMTDLYPEVSELGKAAVGATASGRSKVWRHRDKDGREVPVGVTVRPVEWKGRSAAMVVLAGGHEGRRRRDIPSAREAAGSGR